MKANGIPEHWFLLRCIAVQNGWEATAQRFPGMAVVTGRGTSRELALCSLREEITQHDALFSWATELV